MPNRYRYIDSVEQARELGLAKPYQRKAHIHLLEEKPLIGASTMKGLVGKGETLMQWYADMAAVAGLAFPAQDIKSEYEVVQAISDKDERMKAKRELDEKYPNYAVARRAAVEHRDQKAEEGTERHGELESYVRECLEKSDGRPLTAPLGASASIVSFASWSMDNVARFHFSEAHCYHEGIWVGGIADIGLTLKDGRRLVGDHKSSKEAYQDQFLQCAIYDVLLCHSGGLDRDGNHLFDWEPADGYVVFPFRSEPFTPEFRWNTDEFRKGVESLAQLYKLIELNV